MKRRVISVLLLVVPLLFSALFVERQASAQLTSEVEEQQDILRTARQRAAEARERAHRLREQAVEARASAERTAAERAALQAQVDEAEADLAAANARLALLDSRQATRRERLSQMQGPLVGLVASLQSYARRPAILAISEPSSISEVVHLRAIMTAIEPTIEARTEQVREEIARAFGATDFLLAGSERVSTRIVDLTNGGVDYCFECAGRVEAIDEAFASVRPEWGECFIVGGAAEGSRISIDPNALLFGKRLRGSLLGGLRMRSDVPRLADWYMEGNLKIDELITHRLTLDEINDGFDLMREGRSIRAVIIF